MREGLSHGGSGSWSVVSDQLAVVRDWKQLIQVFSACSAISAVKCLELNLFPSRTKGVRDAFSTPSTGEVEAILTSRFKPLVVATQIQRSQTKTSSAEIVKPTENFLEDSLGELGVLGG
jgi:hypothetical protein